MITVHWSNRLEALADTLFAGLARQQAGSPAAVFAHRQCVIVPNRIIQHWLRHQYLYTTPARRHVPPGLRVLANCEWPLLHVFVNDWLHQMDHPGEIRAPAAHPFSVEAMRWRIYQLLNTADVMDNAAELTRYIHAHATRAPDQRRFKLAGRLARLFDEYMVYRPETLTQWEAGRDSDIPAGMEWEPLLWRQLTHGVQKNKTYLDEFRRMFDATGPLKIGIANKHREIHVFGVSMMPRAYLWFFERLSACLPVNFYLFNPCQTDWFLTHDYGNASDMAHTPAPETFMPDTSAGRLEAPDERSDGNTRARNLMLDALGKGCREFLSETLDVTGGQAEAGSRFIPAPDDTMLHGIQNDILYDRAPVGESKAANARADASVQIHVCHGPLREVEILRDNILRWFDVDKTLQPRDIQAQVSDMATYAPYIDAVFATQARQAPATIPYAIADRVLAGESPSAEAFMRLVKLADSRFTAPDVFNLLNCEGIARTFGFAPNDMPALAGWVGQAGIRWGYDAAQRQIITGVDFSDYTTWQRGLDRLLLGYAMGPADAGDAPLPCDCTEGDDAVMLGRLVHFVASLRQTVSLGEQSRTPAEWRTALTGLLTTFFTGANDNYLDIDILRTAIDALEQSACAAEFAGAIPLAVAREFIAAHLQGASAGGDASGNVVIFSALRAGSSTPRRIMCLLGMSDGQCPRADNRPAYDLLRLKRKTGDRSLRMEDRLAWLEALASARDFLYISHTGFDPTGNPAEIPASVLVRELRELAVTPDSPAGIPETRHKPRAFDPAYFTRNQTGLFSYSMPDFEAAQRLTAGPQNVTPAAGGAAPPLVSYTSAPPARNAVSEIGLDDLIGFFQNPAERYCKQILGIDLRPQNATALDDVEEFDTAGLEQFRANQIIVDAMLDIAPEHESDVAHEQTVMLKTRARLWEDGLIPLEYWGAYWLNTQWQTIRRLLNAQIDGLGRLRDAVRRQRAAQHKTLTVAIRSNATQSMATVSGASATFTDAAGADATLAFRCASPKPKNLLATWIRHVFACAAGLPSAGFHIETKDAAKQDEAARFDPIPAGNAREVLAAYLDMYRAGMENVLPFTPATAIEYVAQSDLGKAQAVWYSSGFYCGDDQDPYYLHAFGPDGPFADPRRFGDTATRALTPFFAAMHPVKIAAPPDHGAGAISPDGGAA